jgi:hypothetical protein
MGHVRFAFHVPAWAIMGRSQHCRHNIKFKVDIELIMTAAQLYIKLKAHNENGKLVVFCRMRFISGGARGGGNYISRKCLVRYM